MPDMIPMLATADPRARALYMLLLVVRPRHLLLLGADEEATRWATAAAGPGASVTVVASPEAAAAVAYDSPVDGCVLSTAPPAALLERLAPHALLIGSAEESAWPDALPGWRAQLVATAEGARLWLAGRAFPPLRYVEAPRDALVALLLGAIRPATLLLGPNVVLDGSAKPPGTRIDFSGAGGQIGAGDLLLAHPDALARYTPLPGAIALLLGEPEEPLQTPHVPLRGSDGTVVTLVVRPE